MAFERKIDFKKSRVGDEKENQKEYVVESARQSENVKSRQKNSSKKRNRNKMNTYIYKQIIY